MKISIQSVLRFLMLIGFAIMVKITAFSQQWAMDEIAEESEGSPFSGIIGAILVFVFIWLLAKLFGGNKIDEENKKTSVQEEPIDNLTSDFVEDDAAIVINDDIDEVPLISSLPSSNSVIPKKVDLSQTQSETKEMDEKSFRNKCIKIYGDYAENTYGMVLIKEDGEYRQISYRDKRYMILSTYIYETKKEHHSSVCTIGDFERLKYFIESIKDMKVFPEANPMDEHGKLEREYLGENIAMMMAYYDETFTKFPIYLNPNNAHSLRDFCLSLGWDLSIYIHRYIQQPMDMTVYHDLKEMILRKMSKEEYLEYKKRSGIITDRGVEGYYDGWGSRIGNTYDEASKEISKRSVISYEQAIKEVNEIEWKL